MLKVPTFELVAAMEIVPRLVLLLASTGAVELLKDFTVLTLPVPLAVVVISTRFRILIVEEAAISGNPPSVIVFVPVTVHVTDFEMKLITKQLFVIAAGVQTLVPIVFSFSEIVIST